MKILIGIISYLPDDSKLKEVRFKKLYSLIERCNQLFNLPIHIIAQNYDVHSRASLLETFKNVSVDFYETPLGITNARKKLREWFLASDYTNLIMLDDDCEIKGTLNDAQNYVNQIVSNPNCFIEFKSTLLKLFCISKEIFAQQDYLDIDAEKSEGFEDTIFVKTLRKKFPDKRRVFNCNLKETSISTKDVYSTWYNNQDLTEMLRKTKQIMENVK